MAFDMFLVLTSATGQPQVSGEPVQDQYFQKYPAAIAVREFSFGTESLSMIGSATSGAGGGKMSSKSFRSRSRWTNCQVAVPDVLGRRAYGQSAVVPPQGRCHDRRKAVLAYGFELVYVSKIDWNGSLGDDEPSERVTFEYGALAVGYYPQKPDGTFDGPVKAAWSVVTNFAPPLDPILTGF